MEYDTKEFRETLEGKELVYKYKHARLTGAEGTEFETFENFCKWAFANGYKPGMKLCRGEKRYNANTSYFRAQQGERKPKPKEDKGSDLIKSIAKWDKTVNAIRRAAGLQPLKGSDADGG